MSMRRTSILVIGSAVLAALVLVAAGCGGGGKKNAATTETATTTAATTQTTSTTAATTQAATTQAATTAAATTQATTTTSNLSGIASAANCRELADLGTKFSSAFTGSASSQDLKKEAQLLQDFASKTPSDIRPDFQEVAAAFSKIVDAVGNIKPGTTPDATTLAKLQKLSTQIDEAKLTAASQRIATWVQKNCHA
jgi:outer membrane murein-binding lipoprotein Lpp